MTVYSPKELVRLEAEARREGKMPWEVDFPGSSGSDPIEDHLSSMSRKDRQRYGSRWTPDNPRQATALCELAGRESAGRRLVDGEAVKDAVAPALAFEHGESKGLLRKHRELSRLVEYLEPSDTSVPARELLATRPFVDRNAVAMAVKSLDGDPAFAGAQYLPVVVRQSGRHYVLAGHHRVEGAMLLGHSDVRCELYDADWREKGGPGSGNFGHEGRPGEVGGSGDGSGKVTTIDQAISRLGRGKGVMFDRPDQAVSLLRKLKEMADEARAAGQKPKVYDLCKVSVPGTNLFCAENVGITRDHMPQLKGVPLPGTPADKMQKDAKGEVDLAPSFRDYLGAQGHSIQDTSEFADRLRASQVEMDGTKVGGMMVAMEQGRIPPAPIFISNENYIVDGHHRWAATVGLSLDQEADLQMPVSRIDMSVLPVLKAANDFAASMGLPQSGVGGKALGVLI